MKVIISKDEYTQLSQFDKLGYILYLDKYYLKGFWLFNILFAHQILLESIKLELASEFLPVLKSIYDDFALYLSKSKYDSLDLYSLAERKKIIKDFAALQRLRFTEYTDALQDNLMTFSSYDLTALTNIYEKVSDGSNDLNSDDLYQDAIDSPIPANGDTILNSLTTFTNAASNRIANLVQMGAVNEWSNRQFLEKFGNDGTNIKGSVLGTFLNQSNASVGIAIQHISSTVQNAMVAEYFNQETWESILDNHTTEICIERNGNVYLAGDGPYPPAHYGCRSKRVAIVGTKIAQSDLPASYFDYLKSQDSVVLETLLGSSLANKILKDEITAKDFESNMMFSGLTIASYPDKIKTLLDQ